MPLSFKLFKKVSLAVGVCRIPKSRDAGLKKGEEAKEEHIKHLADNPIERLCLEPENRRVALSVSHDNVVKLWHVGELLEDDDDEDEGGEKVSGSDDGEGEGEGAPPARKKHKKGKRKKGGFKTQQQAIRKWHK